MPTPDLRGSLPAYEVIVERGVKLPLRDGTPTACDIYRPARGGEPVDEALPALLERTPYDRTRRAGSGLFFAERGYVTVIQDVRGRYDSEGEFYPFAHEAPDGYDSVEWIAAQPWCDGRVGTMGASYCAAVQSALATLDPPHLGAMVVTVGPSSYYHHAMRQNGALEQRFYVYAFTMAATSREAQADPAIKAALDEALGNIWHWVDVEPIRPGTSPLALVPSYERWALDLLQHTTYDDYWRQRGYGPRPYYDEHADVPTLYVGGWYDTYTRATIENWTELSRRQQQPVHLLMGPWTHGGVGDPNAGDVSFLPDGGLAHYESLRLRWFDRWLKELPSGVDAEPPVRYFIMGGGRGPWAGQPPIEHGGEWRTAETWPPPEAAARNLYLHPDGGLRPEPPTAVDSSTTYTFDPFDPVPTIGGNLSAIPIPPGGFDQRNDSRFPGSVGTMPLAARRDVLTFATDPLPEPVTLVGPVTVTLYVSSTAPDTDFTAKLVDVYPPTGRYPAGLALNLTDSLGRLRFRNGYEREELATPGEVYALTFELYPTANRFEAGHRIRIDISSSNYPKFDRNPNTGGPLGFDRRLKPCDNTLWHDAQRASHVTVMVV